MTGFLMIRPSETSLRIVWRELALEISLTSLGSSQILFFPHSRTEAARRFWVRRLTLHGEKHCQQIRRRRASALRWTVRVDIGVANVDWRAVCPQPVSLPDSTLKSRAQSLLA